MGALSCYPSDRLVTLHHQHHAPSPRSPVPSAAFIWGWTCGLLRTPSHKGHPLAGLRVSITQGGGEPL